MFKGTITNTKYFRQFIDSTKELITSANLFLTAEGIDIKTLDDAAIALCNIHFDISDFKSLECTKDFVIGLSLVQLLIVLKLSDEQIVIEYSETDCDKLLITSGSGSNTDAISEYEIKLMDIDVEKLDIPNFDYPCIYEYDSVMFNKTISNYNSIGGDDILMTNEMPLLKPNAPAKEEDGSLYFHITGDSIKCIDNPRPKSIISNKTIKTNYTLKYVHKFMKSSFLSNTVKISMSDEYPLLIEFQKLKTYIQYYLAPKIEGN